MRKTSFYVNSADGKVRYSDFFLQEFIPYIEGKYRIQQRAQGKSDHWYFHGRLRCASFRVRRFRHVFGSERAKCGSHDGVATRTERRAARRYSAG